MKRAQKALQRQKRNAEQRQKTAQLLASLDKVAQELQAKRPDKWFSCEYCGHYSAKDPRCTRCERLRY